MAPAILALWNDYPSMRAEEYEAWHTFEHVPERLTVPGMRGARRYVSSANSESYFTLYELEDLSVTEHPAYLDLVNNPTPWSLKMRQNFSNVLRIVGNITSAGGNGIGGSALVQAYSVERNEAHRGFLELEAFLRECTAEARIVGFKLALAEPNQIYEVFSQDEQTDPDTVNIVVIAESTVVGALATIQNTLTQKIRVTLNPRRCLRNDLFHLLISYRGDEFPNNRREITAGEISKLWVG
jgi:hypothetical protein